MKKQTTIRLPKKLVNNLDSLSDNLGFTRSDLIKSAVLKYLVSDKLEGFQEITSGSGEVIRTGIYFNENLKGILSRQAKANNTSINALVIYSASKTYEYYSKLLKELGC